MTKTSVGYRNLYFIGAVLLFIAMAARMLGGDVSGVIDMGCGFGFGWILRHAAFGWKFLAAAEREGIADQIRESHVK